MNPPPPPRPNTVPTPDTTASTADGDSRSDAELIAAVLAGDRAAFEPLVHRHQNAIYGYLYRFLGRDVEAARDITQSAFLKAYEHLARVDPSRPFRSWLYRVAHNEAVSSLRRAGVRGEVPMEAPTENTLSDDAPSPEAEEARSEEQQAVHAALAQMSPRERSV